MSCNSCDYRSICVSIPARAANPTDKANTGVTIPAANISLRVAGKFKQTKPTIIFIHGYEAQPENLLAQQLFLCKRYFTIAVTLRGHGQSTKTPVPAILQPPASGQINYSMEVFSGDVNAVLTKIGITNNIILICHSMGVGVGINYMVNYSGVIKAILISGAPLYLANCDPTIPIPIPPCIDTVNDCNNCTNTCCQQFPITNAFDTAPLCCSFPGSLGKASALSTAVSNCVANCSGNQQCGINCWLTLNTQPTLTTDTCSSPEYLQFQQATAQYFFLVNNDPLRSAIFTNIALNALSEDQRLLLNRIGVPILLAVGTNDKLVHPQNSTYMFQRFPFAILAEFQGKSHVLMTTDAAEFNCLALKFIKDCELLRHLIIPDTGCHFCSFVYNNDFTECIPSF